MQNRDSIIKAETAASNWLLKMPSGKIRGLGGGLTGRKSGSSHEFLEHRDYIPGDDLRRVDWNAFARSDKLTVKCFQEEVSPYIDILMDNSLSVGEPHEQKAEATAATVSFLATAARNSGFQVRAWQSSHGFERFMDDKGRASSWLYPEFTATMSPHESFHKTPPAIRPNGVVVLISDLLWLEDPSSLVSRLAREAAMLIVVQVLADEELDPSMQGPYKLEDSEGGEPQELIIDESVLKDYRQRLQNHTNNWIECCRAHKGVFMQMSAEELLENWQFDELIRMGILTKF